MSDEAADEANPPVIQYGNVTPGHLAVWTTNGVVADGGPAPPPASALPAPFVLQTGLVTPGHLAVWTTAGVIQDYGQAPAIYTFNITTIQIPLTVITYDTITVTGYYVGGDLGAGAIYTSVGATVGGPGAVYDNDGTLFNLVFNGKINIGWLGAKGDGSTDDAPAFQAAVNYNAVTPGSAIFLPSGYTYTFASTVIVSGAWFAIECDDYASITSSIAGFGRITSTTTADTTIPTTSNPGPMRGCLFYFTSLIYYTYIKNIRFSSFRFALAYLTPHNAPQISGCHFSNGNCGIICYQGSQNYQVIDYQSNCDVLWISSATCFPSGSTYANADNYYTDGFTLANVSEYNSSSAAINSYFDDWFVASFLRPSVVSVSVGGSTTYKDSSGATYADNSYYCQPTGRLFFIPVRNPRSCFSLTLYRLYVVGPCYRGFGLINTTIYDAEIDAPSAEGMWDNSAPNTTNPAFSIGSAQDGYISPCSPTDWNNQTGGVHKLIDWTGRGQVSTGPSLFSMLGTNYPPGGTAAPAVTSNAGRDQFFGFNQGVSNRLRENLYVAENSNPSIDNRASAAIIYTADFTVGTSYTDSQVYTVEDGIPKIFTLPQLIAAQWFSDARLTFNPPIAGANLTSVAGELIINVRNLTTGEWDHGEYYIQIMAPALAATSETLTTAADINNGDLYFAVTTTPKTLARFGQWLLASGVYVGVDYYDSANKRIYVIGMVTGLASTVTSGSSVTCTQSIETLIPMQRNWITPAFGNVPFSNAYNLGIKNNTMAYTDTDTKTLLYVEVKFRNTPYQCQSLYTSVAPIAGQYGRNALTRTNLAALGGPVGRVCITSGTTGGTFAPFGFIGGPIYKTNSATTSATLTAANITGGASVWLGLTGALGGAANATLPTAAAVVAAVPNLDTNDSWTLRIINSSSGAFTWTVINSAGNTWTLNGTMTIPQNTWRDFIVKIDSTTAGTIQSGGSGTI